MRRSVILFLGVMMTNPAEAKLLSVIDRALRGAVEHQLGMLNRQVDMLKEQLNVERQVDKHLGDGFRDLNRDLSGSFEINKRVSADGMTNSWIPSRMSPMEVSPGENSFTDFNAAYRRRYSFSESEVREVKRLMDADRNRLAEAHLTDATLSYNALVADQKRIDALISEVDKAKTTKEALDLNNRLQAEVLATQNKILRLNAESRQADALESKRDAMGTDAIKSYMGVER